MSEWRDRFRTKKIDFKDSQELKASTLKFDPICLACNAPTTETINFRVFDTGGLIGVYTSLKWLTYPIPLCSPCAQERKTEAKRIYLAWCMAFIIFGVITTTFSAAFVPRSYDFAHMFVFGSYFGFGIIITPLLAHRIVRSRIPIRLRKWDSWKKTLFVAAPVKWPGTVHGALAKRVK